MSVLTRSSQCHITEDGIPHSHRRKNLKSYVFLQKFFILHEISVEFWEHSPNSHVKMKIYKFVTLITVFSFAANKRIQMMLHLHCCLHLTETTPQTSQHQLKDRRPSCVFKNTNSLFLLSRDNLSDNFCTNIITISILYLLSLFYYYSLIINFIKPI
jgi:heme/copper-type cytochrome/quinol oxidase subunit 4